MQPIVLPAFGRGFSTFRRATAVTPQENQLLQDFLAELTRARVEAKDGEAQALIARAFAQQPDAAYLLVQRALLLEQALKQAKAEISQRQDHSAGFIGADRGWSRAPAPTAPPVAPAPVAPQAQTARPSPGPTNGWGGFLGNAAATAAGVAGGAFLFQGLEDLLGHRVGGFLSADMPPETVENVTVNNYDHAGDADSSAFTGADDTDADSDQDWDAQDYSSDDSSWT